MQEPTVSHERTFRSPSPTEIRNQEQHLSWEDLVFISSKSWGLRNAKTAANTKKEKAMGFNGDALSISAVHNLLSDEEFFRLADPSKHITPEHKPYGFLMTPRKGYDEKIRIDQLRYALKTKALVAIPTLMQPQILVKYEKAIKNFIHDSLQSNLRERDLFPNDPISTLQQDLSSNGFGFILGEFSSGDSGYDVARYYGLGKCGKQYRESTKIVDAITSEGHIQDSLVHSQQGTFLNDLTERFFQEIVASIQKQRKV